MSATEQHLAEAPLLVERKLSALLGLERVFRQFQGSSLEGHFASLRTESTRQLLRHGRFGEWWSAVDELPAVLHRRLDLARDCPLVTSDEAMPSLDRWLHRLGPWKKGPFSLFGTHIDAEWRSDQKWRRVQAIATPLNGRSVLDVGTGNGYFLVRAAGDGAAFVLGLEPSVLFACQYMAISHCFGDLEMALLPLPAERFVGDCALFDTVMSMGVLYHRRSPLDHLALLKSFLKPGGELVLETLVVAGSKGYSLLPADRYAGMRNVWFLPSVDTLQSWLSRLGFVDIAVGSQVATTSKEQRATAWSGPVSLSDFLSPDDPSRTIEGHPSPNRVMMVARAPG